MKSLFLLYRALKAKGMESQKDEAEKLVRDIDGLLDMEDQAEAQPPYLRPAPGMLRGGNRTVNEFRGSHTRIG